MSRGAARRKRSADKATDKTPKPEAASEDAPQASSAPEAPEATAPPEDAPTEPPLSLFINDEEREQLRQRVHAAVARAVEAGLQTAEPPEVVDEHFAALLAQGPAELVAGLEALEASLDTAAELRKAEAAAEAEKEAKAEARRTTAAAARAAARAAQKGATYRVAPGRAITSRRGTLAPGEAVTPKDLHGGDFRRLEALVAAGALVRD